MDYTDVHLLCKGKLQAYCNEDVRITPVGGGCINRCFRLFTSERDLFLKLNHADLFPGMFESEAKGLNALNEARSIHVPHVMMCGKDGETAFILMEYVHSAAFRDDFWKEFGKQLAKLHRQSADAFGFEQDNYIGSLRQSNRKHTDWIDFFIEERLEPQLRMAKNSGKISDKIMAMFPSLYKRLNQIFPVEPPALVHGDLWNGNFIANSRGLPCIFDPAVYFGHREMDVAMTKLFGGFDETFYAAYDETYPLESGWELRTDICNLYPLMVHVNLFGGSYLNQAYQILKRF